MLRCRGATIRPNAMRLRLLAGQQTQPRAVVMVEVLRGEMVLEPNIVGNWGTESAGRRSGERRLAMGPRRSTQGSIWPLVCRWRACRFLAPRAVGLAAPNHPDGHSSE